LFLAERRAERELAAKLSVGFLATNGDAKAVKKQIDEWEKDQ
jgi:hypothetical protein